MVQWSVGVSAGGRRVGVDRALCVIALGKRHGLRSSKRETAQGPDGPRFSVPGEPDGPWFKKPGGHVIALRKRHGYRSS